MGTAWVNQGNLWEGGVVAGWAGRYRGFGGERLFLDHGTTKRIRYPGACTRYMAVEERRQLWVPRPQRVLYCRLG